MTEIKSACPAHNSSTRGSDSYYFNTVKRVGECKSCGLSTWEDDKGRLWGRRSKAQKPFLVDDGGLVAEDEEDVCMTLESGSTKEGRIVPMRGLTKETLEFFGVYQYGDEQRYVYPSGGTKTRNTAHKAFYSGNGFKGDELFGMNLFPAGCAKVLTITEGECFPETAEILTPNGWKQFNQLYAEDRVMQVNSDGTGSWVVPYAIIDKQFSGDLVEYKSGSYYSLTTPEHNLVRNHPKEGLKKFKAEVNSFFSIPRVADLQGWCGYTIEQLQLWVMLSADFTFRKSGDIYGAFKKQRKIDRVKQLLSNYGVRFSANKVKNSYTSVFIHRGHNLDFAKKDLPWSMVWSQHKKEILDEIIFWDGNRVKGRNQAEFATNRKHNADVVQALAHSCGYVSTIMNRSNQYGEWLKVSILFGKTSSSTQKGYKKVTFSGRVMCVQVPSGMIIVRQNGSISISGNCDAMSAYQMLKSSYLNPVVGLPGANPSGKLWEKCKTYLDSFEKIVVSADKDEPGQKVLETMFDLFPGKIYVMDHGQHKDANDFLQAGDGAAYKSAWWKAKKYSPAGFTASVDDWMTALEEEDPYEYVPTPFADFNKVGRGLVKGGITVIKAPPGSGKSSLLRCLQHHIVTKENLKVACLMMEEVKSITGRAMASYQLGKNVMTKEDAEWSGVSEEEVKEALKEVLGEEKFVSFDINPQDPVEDTLRQCNHAIAVYGADYIWIDHLQRLAYLAGTDNATANLTSLGVKLTELAKRKNVGIIAISHVNEDGAVKYAKSIEEEAIVVIELERDRFAEDMEERNTAYLTITKNRPFGSTGAAGALTYDAETTILSEKQGPKEPKVDRKDF